MSDEITMDISGIEQAMRNLSTLETKAIRRVVSAGVRAGNKAVIKEARAMAPVRTGQLRRQIRGSVKLDRSTGTVIGTVKAKSTKKERQKKQYARVAHLVIAGTKPHEIRAKKTGLSIGGNAIVRVVQHPGSRPNPFIERAANHVWRKAVNDFSHKFNEKLDAEVAKLPKK